jgi:hypothetical protein
MKDSTLNLIILTTIWFFIGILSINLSYLDGYKKGWHAGVESTCPDKVDEVTR